MPPDGAVAGGVHDLRTSQHARERDAGRDRLRDRDQVGLDAEVLDGEGLARTTKARLHLVDHEDDAVLVADPPQALHELAGGNDEAALALDGLDHDRRDVFGRHARLEGVLERVEVVEWHPVGLGCEGAQARLVRMRLRGETEGEERPPVEGALEADHRRPLREGPGELDRVLDRLGA